jgi:hypothetical protein
MYSTSIREVPGRANHVTHPSPLGVPSHQADVQIVEAMASRSCTLPRVHTVLDLTCIEHPSMSVGQELSGHCLDTTSSHDHTSVCSTKQLFMRRVRHSPYISTGREFLDAVCSRTPSLNHTSVCRSRGPNNPAPICCAPAARQLDFEPRPHLMHDAMKVRSVSSLPAVRFRHTRS